MWGELASHKRSLTHHPSFSRLGIQVSLAIICLFVWAMVGWVTSYFLKLVCYAHVFPCTLLQSFSESAIMRDNILWSSTYNWPTSTKFLSPSPLPAPFSVVFSNCIGQEFAINEMKTILSCILRHFELTLDPDRPPQKNLQVIMRPKNGLYLKLKHRNV